MAATPSFASTPRVGIGQLTTANTNINGSGVIVNLLTSSSTGTKINEIIIKAYGTVTAGMIRFYTFDGTSNYLFDEIGVSAATPSSTSQTFLGGKTYDNLVLPSGYSIRASTFNSENFNVIVLGADL